MSSMVLVMVTGFFRLLCPMPYQLTPYNLVILIIDFQTKPMDPTKHSHLGLIIMDVPFFFLMAQQSYTYTNYFEIMEYIAHGSKNQINSSFFHLLWSDFFETNATFRPPDQDL